MTQIPRIDWSVAEHSLNEIIVRTIYSIEETRQALQLVQERKTVVLILDQLTTDKAQRVVDWMAGGICAIDGQTFWVAEKTFMFVPNQVQIQSDRPRQSSVSPSLKTG
ncbi:MAG TPA: cell division protein SepF [Cyanothece sp. UBA12306]|nr:cell division protein SepF [Cyanothece sp. UBA12306]